MNEAKPIKSGFYSSEFWLSVATTVLGHLYAAGAISDGGAVSQVAGIAASILGLLGYQVSRTMVKRVGK